MKTSTSITKIAPALLKAQKAMGNATKDSNNPFFKSKFADLNSVREAVTPALHENGISVLQLNGHAMLLDHSVPVVITTLLHESGEYISSETEIVVKEANNPQQYGSAISYARRYGLQSMLSIGAEDDDGEKSMGRQPKATNIQTVNSQTSPTGTNGPVPGGTGSNTGKGSFTSFRKNT